MLENVYSLFFFERIVSIMAKQKRYNKDFKLQAAELVARQGYSMAEASYVYRSISVSVAPP